MELSKDTKEVVQYLDDIAEGNLRKKNDLGVILEISATYSLAELLENLIFDGASLWRIYQILKKSGDDDILTNLKSEFNEVSGSIIPMLTEITDYFEDVTLKKRFLEIYLSGTLGSLKNIIDLSHDFSILKEVQNKLKPAVSQE